MPTALLETTSGSECGCCSKDSAALHVGSKWIRLPHEDWREVGGGVVTEKKTEVLRFIREKTSASQLSMGRSNALLRTVPEIG